MLRMLTASSILALAAIPAIAQQADPAAATPVTEAPAPTEPSSAPGPIEEPAPEATSASPSAAPAPADPSAAPAPTAADGRQAQVAKVVDAEFPIYDANKTGDLEQPEFNKWVLALHAASNDPTAKAMDEAAKTKWATDAFASADADKNKKISKAEISKFLLG